MLTVFVRVVVLYGVSVLAMRLMGKRQVGQLQPYELVLALMVAEIAASPMEDVATPLLHGLVPIMSLLFLHGVFTALALKSPGIRRILNGVPGVVIREGNVDYGQMKRMGYTMTDLLEELRGLGYEDISHIHTAILETNGRLSAFPKGIFSPVTCEDMHLDPGEGSMPLLLIADGKVQEKEMGQTGRSLAWLRRQIKQAGAATEKEVLVASLNGKGELFVQLKGDRPSCILPAEVEE